MTSLRLVKSRFPTVLLVAGLTDTEMAQFEQDWVTIVPLPALPSGVTPHGRGLTFSKLAVWSLTQFDKLVVLDVDALVQRNIDHLFAAATPAAVLDPKWASDGSHRGSEARRRGRPSMLPFNSGLLVVSPNRSLYAKMVQQVGQLFSYDRGDQGFLASFFAQQGIPWHELPRRYSSAWCTQPDEDRNAYVHHLFGGRGVPMADELKALSPT